MTFVSGVSDIKSVLSNVAKIFHQKRGRESLEKENRHRELLQWALREELPKGNAVSDDIGGIVARRFRKGSLGMAASLSRRHDRDTMGFVPGTPHEDALIVGDAVHLLDSFASFEERHQAAPLFGGLVAIADDAISAILCASFDPRSIIISNAIQSKRPKCDFEQPAPRQQFLQTRVGRPRGLVHGTDADGDIVYLQARRGSEVRRYGLYDLAMSPRSPLSWGDPSLISIGHARAEYVAWHAALESLANNLRDHLVEFEVLPPAARPMPWITGQAPASRVLSGDMQPDVLTIKLALQPKRRAPDRPLESEISIKARAKAEFAREKKRQEMPAPQR